MNYKEMVLLNNTVTFMAIIYYERSCVARKLLIPKHQSVF